MHVVLVHCTKYCKQLNVLTPFTYTNVEAHTFRTAQELRHRMMYNAEWSCCYWLDYIVWNATRCSVIFHSKYV